MPKLASSEKIINLFDSLFEDNAQKDKYITELEKVFNNSKLNQDYFRYRFQLFKKLIKITKKRDDLRLLIKNHDLILNSIEKITDEDITGYHHYYSLTEINDWIRISNNCDDFIEIIKSYTQKSTAILVAQRNNKKIKQLNKIKQRKEFD
jgi:hypothetical protein